MDKGSLFFVALEYISSLWILWFTPEHLEIWQITDWNFFQWKFDADLNFYNRYFNNFLLSIDTGKKEQIEAVNLELVSMRPYAGNNLQTKGQEACEVPADPYEEYFVPVNEHRKYIR